MARISMNVKLTKEQIDSIGKRCHFEGEEFQKILMDVYWDIDQVSKPMAYYKIMKEEMPFVTCTLYAGIIVTLGSASDKLLECYEQEGEYLKVYAGDVLLSELLFKAMDRVEEILEEEHYYMKRKEFFGEPYPLEQVSILFEELKPDQVEYNKAFAMCPKKTTAYIGILSNKPVKKEHPCEGCKRMNCSMRKKHKSIMEYSYGYQRIFGK